MKSMRNNIKLKACLTKVFILTIILLSLFIILNIKEYNYLKNNTNAKVLEVLSIVKKKYPNITDEELLNILNSKSNHQIDLNKYGIDLTIDDISISNNKAYPYILIINSLYLFLSISIILYLLLQYNKHKNKELKDITNYLEEINNQNYSLKMDSLSEDELSILKNELYKVTVSLKENALNNELDKLNLKESLEDISHQLKTPLTSILIILDNLNDEDMDGKIKKEFLHDIKREVMNINFLIQNLLKLSKFDVNAITFKKENVKWSKILKEVIKNVAYLSDLKNITIVKDNNDGEIYCDYNWEIEALTNILKNSLEHSKENKKIYLNFSSNKIYDLVTIKDEGKGISKKDLPHIFERFYQSNKASKDSIGIGLSLAKTIIEKDNGSISVASSNKGTTFIIKYYK